MFIVYLCKPLTVHWARYNTLSSRALAQTPDKPYRDTLSQLEIPPEAPCPTSR